MGNDFYNPTGYENEGLPSGRNLEGQIALWHPVKTKSHQKFCIFILDNLFYKMNKVERIMKKLNF